MEKAIRVVSIERGRDPREFALVAFGGAGGLHACALAEALSIPQVIVPALPGALSALGILVSDVVKDYSRTVLWRVAGTIPNAQLKREFFALQKKAAKDFRQEAWQGRVHYQPSVDVRYRGQGYELNLPFTRNLQKEFRARTPAPLRLCPFHPRTRAGNPPPASHIADKNACCKEGPCGDGHSCPSRPGKARLAFHGQSLGIIRRQETRDGNLLARDPGTRQEVFRPRRHHRIQRHHNHPAGQALSCRRCGKSVDSHLEFQIHSRIKMQSS